MPEHPVDPAGDQKVARLSDLQRLRSLMHPYVTDSSAGIREALGRMPAADRAKAEEILRQLGDLDSTRHQHRQEILLDLAGMASYLDHLARNPDNAEDVARLRREVEHLRSQFTDLPPETGEGQS